VCVVELSNVLIRSSTRSIVFPVDSKTRMQVAFYSTLTDSVEFQLYDPHNQPLDMASHLIDVFFFFFFKAKIPYSSTGETVAAPGWAVDSPVIGSWTLMIHPKKTARQITKKPGNSYMLLWNDSEEKLSSYINSLKMKTGKKSQKRRKKN